MNLINKYDYEDIKKLSNELLGKVETKNISFEKLENLLKNDKKTEGNEVNFVIIKKSGDTKFLKLPLNAQLMSEIKRDEEENRKRISLIQKQDASYPVLIV